MASITLDAPVGSRFATIFICILGGIICISTRAYDIRLVVKFETVGVTLGHNFRRVMSGDFYKNSGILQFQKDLIHLELSGFLKVLEI
jgi:hypothetical protein